MIAVCAICAMGLTAGSAWGIAGVGVHYGVADLTLNMEDAEGQTFDFLDAGTLQLYDTAQINAITGQALQGELLDTLFEITQAQQSIQGAPLPVFVDRLGWERSPVNFGGKFYIDIIPVLNAVELSLNFGMWQYDGQVRYPTGVKSLSDISDMRTDYGGLDSIPMSAVFEYDTMAITMEVLKDSKYFGMLDRTPYAKLHFDATVRKTIATFPPVVNMFKLYGGGGPSVHFATPLLSTELVETAIGDSLQGKTLAEVNQFMQNPVKMEPVLTEILTSLFTPRVGMHLIAGIHFKPPILPVGVYVDGKYMIMFQSMDENVDLGGHGLLINAGVTVGL
jgi:hypothetical protein